MTRLPTLKSRTIERGLKRAGFLFIRQKGSHRIYSEDKTLVVLPWHNRDIKKGTLRNIIKCSGLTKKEFLKLTKKGKTVG